MVQPRGSIRRRLRSPIISNVNLHQVCTCCPCSALSRKACGGRAKGVKRSRQADLGRWWGQNARPCAYCNRTEKALSRSWELQTTLDKNSNQIRKTDSGFDMTKHLWTNNRNTLALIVKCEASIWQMTSFLPKALHTSVGCPQLAKSCPSSDAKAPTKKAQQR